MSNIEPVVRNLIAEKEAAKVNSKAWKDIEKGIDAKLGETINIEEILRLANKLENGGSKTSTQDGGKFELEAKKEVKWDSAKLQELAGTLPWQSVIQLFKITFEMKEAVYKGIQDSVNAGLQDPSFLEKLNDARTVKIGEPRIKSAKLID